MWRKKQKQQLKENHIISDKWNNLLANCECVKPCDQKEIAFCLTKMKKINLYEFVTDWTTDEMICFEDKKGGNRKTKIKKKKNYCE